MTLREAREITIPKITDLNPLQYVLEGSDVPIEDRLEALNARFEAEKDLSPFRTQSVVLICKKIAEHFGVTPAQVIPNLLGIIPATVSDLPDNTLLPPDIEELVRQFERFPFEQVPE